MEDIEHETLGDILRERREALNLSLDELADTLRIPPKYLRRIERGEWKALPSEVYRKGFLKKYSAALGMDSEEVLELYREDQERAVPPTFAKIARPRWNTLKETLYSLSPRLWRRALIAVVFAAILGYIGYQLSVALVPPALEITEPSAAETVVQGEAI